MNIKHYAGLLLIMIVTACASINDPALEFPMYGRLPRTPQQLNSDSNYVKRMEDRFDSRQQASVYYSQLGWSYYTQQNYDLAMRRFNQSWLLDSTNCQAYWGFGSLQGMKNQWQESNDLLFRSIQYGCSDALIYQAVTSNYFALFDSIKDLRYIDTAYTMTDYGLILNPYSARICNQRSICFYYYGMPDSALTWANRAMSIDPNSVSREYINLIVKEKLDGK